jgi:hypothetical protein
MQWPDQHVVALGELTPRTAAKRKKGVHDLRRSFASSSTMPTFCSGTE